MNRINSFALFFVIAVIGTLTESSSAFSPAEEMRCAIATFDVEYDRSAAVFAGKVVKMKKEGNKKHFVFKVKRFWKGVSSKKIELSVSENPRYQAIYEEGKTYLVFAKRNEDTGALWDGRCSRSAEIGGYSSNLKNDLEKLGEGKTCIDLSEEGESVEKS